MAQLAVGAVVVGGVLVAKALSSDEHPDDKEGRNKSVCRGREEAAISYHSMSTRRVRMIAETHRGRTEDLIVYVGKGKWKGSPSSADKQNPKKNQRWWISADKGRRKYAHRIDRTRGTPEIRTPNPDRTITWTHIYILDNTTSGQTNTEKEVYDLLHDRIGDEQAQFWTANAKACDRDEDDYIYVLVGSVYGETEHCIVQ
jgi:hypothetical protein